MDAAIYFGARDIEETMQHSGDIPQRAFTDLTAAKWYALSSFDKAQELIEGQWKVYFSSQEMHSIVNDFIPKLAHTRCLIEDIVVLPGGNNHDLDRFVEACEELRSLGRRALEMRGADTAMHKRICAQTIGIFGMCFLILVLLPAMMSVMGVSDTIIRHLSILLIVSFMVSTIWGMQDASRKDEQKIIAKRIELADQIERATAAITKVVEDIICPFLPRV